MKQIHKVVVIQKEEAGNLAIVGMLWEDDEGKIATPSLCHRWAYAAML